MKELLDKRAQTKRRKPHFQMQDSHKLSRLTQKWRKPRGIDSKMRLGLKGYARSVEVGFKSPKDVRGLDKSGLLPVMVSSVKELESVNKEKEGAIISSAVGQKKKKDLVAKATEMGITLLNIKDPKAFAASVEKNMKERADRKKKRIAKATEKKAKEEKKKPAEKKKEDLSDKVLSEDEKAKAEKKEKDKILTTKE